VATSANYITLANLDGTGNDAGLLSLGTISNLFVSNVRGYADQVPSIAVGAGSAITSSGPGGAQTVLAYTTPGTGVAAVLANAVTGSGAPVAAIAPTILNQIQGGLAFASLPGSPAAGQMAYITDGKSTNCGDSSCTTFGTTITGGSGSLKLLAWYNAVNWTLIGK
jgi:hypothetical protein